MMACHFELFGVKIDADDYEKVSPHRWYKTSGGYVMCKNRKVCMYLHRFVLNYDGPLIVDHINHDKLDNRKANLRLCTQVENQNNRTLPLQANNSSGINGVSPSQYGWHAYVWIKRKRIHLGYYSSAEVAGKARRLYEEGKVDVSCGKLYEKGTCFANLIDPEKL